MLRSVTIGQPQMELTIVNSRQTKRGGHNDLRTSVLQSVWKELSDEPSCGLERPPSLSAANSDCHSIVRNDLCALQW